MTARSFLGAGDVYLEAIVGGVGQGLIGPIYADKLELKPDVDTKQSTSKGRHDYGQVLETVNLGKPTELTLDLKEVVGNILVMAFQGTAEALDQASGTLAATSYTAKLGKWVSLNHLNFLTVVVKDSAAATTYVEGTDYKVNKDLGLLQAIDGGAIEDMDVVKVNGTYAAATGTIIKGQTNVDIRARILFDGINQADGTQATVEVYEAVITADSAFDFLANDFGVVSLKGTVKTPAGKDEPYTVTIQDPVAA